jgi:transcriptional regulator with XRE-family HTH domain
MTAVTRAAGTRIRALRKERGWSQLDLARKANVSQGTVCNAERASTPTSVATVTAVAGAFGLEPADLLGGCQRCEPRDGAAFLCLSCGTEGVPR